MSIHQTKDGRWFVAYRKPGERKVYREYCGRGPEGKLSAKRWETEYLEGRATGQAAASKSPTSDITFAELAQKYLNARPLAKNTRYSIVGGLNLHVMPYWGDLRIGDLNMAHLAEVDERLAKAGRSLGTRNRIRAYCKAICQWGLNNDLCDHNPFARFRPDIKREGKAPDLITTEELQAIYKAAPPHLQWAITVMLNTGVRPGETELFALKMSDIDFEGGGIWVTRGKTHSKRALLPLQANFLEALEALKESEPGRVHLVEYKGEQVGSLKTAWTAAKRRANITRRLRLYDLRHWYASSLLSSGADIKAASELLGHASPNTTLATYYHLMDRQKKETVGLLRVPELASQQRASNKPPDKPKGQNSP